MEKTFREETGKIYGDCHRDPPQRVVTFWAHFSDFERQGYIADEIDDRFPEVYESDCCSGWESHAQIQRKIEEEGQLLEKERLELNKKIEQMNKDGMDIDE